MRPHNKENRTDEAQGDLTGMVVELAAAVGKIINKTIGTGTDKIAVGPAMSRTIAGMAVAVSIYGHLGHLVFHDLGSGKRMNKEGIIVSSK